MSFPCKDAAGGVSFSVNPPTLSFRGAEATRNLGFLGHAKK